MPMNGSTVLLAVDVSATTTPDWDIIPCQVTGSYQLDADTFDTSCKDTGDATNLPGRRSRTVSVEANPASWPDIVSSPTAVDDVLRKAAETGLQVDLAFMVSAATVEWCTASITSYGIEAPDQEKVTVSIEFAVSGGMTALTTA